MPDPETPLRLATPEELEFTLSQALLRDGRKSFQSAREMSASITATHRIEQLHCRLYSDE